MSDKKKRYRLRNLEVDRVDLVDQGANQHAYIVINKAKEPDVIDSPEAFIEALRRRKKKQKGAKGSAFADKVAADSSKGAPYAKHGNHNQESHGNWADGSKGPRKAKRPSYTPDEREPDDKFDSDYGDDPTEADYMADRAANRYERDMRKAFPMAQPPPRPQMQPPGAPAAKPAMPGKPPMPAPQMGEDDDTKNGENPRDKLAQFMRQRAEAKAKTAPPPPPAAPGGLAAAPGAPPAPAAPPGAAPPPPQKPPSAPGAPSMAPGAAPQTAARPQMPKTSADLLQMMQQRKMPNQQQPPPAR